MAALALLLRGDVVQSMPPYALWLRGRDELLAWFSGPGAGCAGSVLVPVDVNGSPGYAQYRDGGATPWGITTMASREGRVAEITTFLETDGSLFAAFGLPPAHSRVDRTGDRWISASAAVSSDERDATGAPDRAEQSHGDRRRAPRGRPGAA